MLSVVGHTHTHNSFLFLMSCLFTYLVAFEFPVLIPLLVCYSDRRSVVVYLCALILSNETFPYCTLPYVILTLLEVTKLDLLQETIPDKRITPIDAESFEVMLGSTTFWAPESLSSLSGWCFVPLQVFIHFLPAWRKSEMFPSLVAPVSLTRSLPCLPLCHSKNGR